MQSAVLGVLLKSFVPSSLLIQEGAFPTMYDKICQEEHAVQWQAANVHGLEWKASKRCEEHRNLFDAPRYLQLLQGDSYRNGATVAAQVAMPPLGTARTTPSSIEQKERTPCWELAGFASAW